MHATAQPVALTTRALTAAFERLSTDGRLSLHLLRRAFPGATPAELERAVLALLAEGRHALGQATSPCWLAQVQRDAAIRVDGRAWHYLERA